MCSRRWLGRGTSPAARSIVLCLTVVISLAPAHVEECVVAVTAEEHTETIDVFAVSVD